MLVKENWLAMTETLKVIRIPIHRIRVHLISVFDSRSRNYWIRIHSGSRSHLCFYNKKFHKIYSLLDQKISKRRPSSKRCIYCRPTESYGIIWTWIIFLDLFRDDFDILESWGRLQIPIQWVNWIRIQSKYRTHMAEKDILAFIPPLLWLIYEFNKNTKLSNCTVFKQKILCSHGLSHTWKNWPPHSIVFSVLFKYSSKKLSNKTFVQCCGRIRIGFNADPDTDPDPAFFVNADADPDPDPGFWWAKFWKNLNLEFFLNIL